MTTQTQFTVRGQQYSQIILPLARQEKSMLYDRVYVKQDIVGKSFYQDQIGTWSMAAKTSANASTPQNDPNLSRTRIDILTYNDARTIDRSLNLQSFSDPMTMASVSIQSSVGIKMDEIIYDALGGTALRGEAGGTSVTFPAGKVIAKDFEATSTNTGLTVQKIREAGRLLDAAGVTPFDRTIVASATAKSQLLGTTQAASNDYVNGKPLDTGVIRNFYGFDLVFLPDGIIDKTSDIASYFAFQKTGLCFGMLEEMFLRIDEREDLSYSKQAYYEISAGAARLEEAKVIKILGDETVVV